MMIFKLTSDSLWTFFTLQFLSFLASSNSSMSRSLIGFSGNRFINRLSDGIRMKRDPEHIITDCMTVTSDKGHYFFKTSKDWIKFQNEVCGVYFMANPDEIIQIHFDHLEMPCEAQNVVSFVDGWELNGAYFPSDEDHPKSAQNRFHEFCGWRRPKEVFESSQNAALIRFRVPRAGKGFSFFVTTRKNPMPCNIMVDSSNYIYTLRNYGQRVNCSLLAMNPAKIQILSLTVGINNFERNVYTETGTFHNCDKNGIQDYVQIGGGTDLSQYSVIADSICGIDSTPGDVMDAIFCGVTKIRLVSSGNVNNVITLTIDKVQIEETAESGILCPSASSH